MKSLILSAVCALSLVGGWSHGDESTNTQTINGVITTTGPQAAPPVPEGMVDHEVETNPFRLQGIEPLEEKVEAQQGHIEALLSEDESSPGYRRIFVCSKEELAKPEIMIQGTQKWFALVPSELEECGSNVPTHVTRSYFSAQAGKQYAVRAQLEEEGVAFLNVFEVVDSQEGKQLMVKESVEKELAFDQEDTSTMLVGWLFNRRGSSSRTYSQPSRTYSQPRTTYVQPQSYGQAQSFGTPTQSGLPSIHTIARQRANQAASMGYKGHVAGNGATYAAEGTFYEGFGWSSNNPKPNTCVGPGAPVADATARGRDGYYRVRYYRGATRPTR